MNTPQSHTRFIVGCITMLSLVSAMLGSYLILRGFQSGELLVANGAIAGIAGLIGFLSNASKQPPSPEPPIGKESLQVQPQPTDQPKTP